MVTSRSIEMGVHKWDMRNAYKILIEIL